MIETKRVTSRAQLKEGESGQLQAVFSTFDIVDGQGDIVLASAFTDGQAVPMVWSHDWNTIVGKGVVRVESEHAVFDGGFFMDTQAGQEAYKTVKNMDDLQEYSWGFRILDANWETRDGEDVRVITKAEVYEVSPVLVGANRETYTLAIKGGPESSLPYAEHLERVLAQVTALIDRTKGRVDARTKEGRTLSTANRERLASIRDALQGAQGDLSKILDDTDPGKQADIARLEIEHLAVIARRQGVTV